MQSLIQFRHAKSSAYSSNVVCTAEKYAYLWWIGHRNRIRLPCLLVACVWLAGIVSILTYCLYLCWYTARVGNIWSASQMWLFWWQGIWLA